MPPAEAINLILDENLVTRHIDGETGRLSQPQGYGRYQKQHHRQKKNKFPYHTKNLL